MLKIDKIFAITEEDKIRLAVDRKTNLNIAVGEEEKISDAVDRQNLLRHWRSENNNML